MPNLTTCITCGVHIPVGTGGRCYRHKNSARRLRSTAEWTRISRSVRESGVCARCTGAFAPSELEAHHLIPAAENPEQTLTGPVVALCRRCHHLVTHEEREP